MEFKYDENEQTQFGDFSDVLRDPCCGDRGDIGSSGDVNLDGSIDAEDIEGFINCLFP